MNEHPTPTDEEWAAVEALRDELAEEEAALHEWMNQPIDDPNPNRWRH